MGEVVITWAAARTFLPWIIAAVAVAGMFWLTHKLGYDAGTAECQEQHAIAAAQAAADAAKLDKRQTVETADVRVEYVERIVEVEKRVPVVTERLVRVCNTPAPNTDRPPVPSVPGVRDGGPRTNAPDRPADSVDALGRELLACRRNAELHRALRATAIANGALIP